MTHGAVSVVGRHLVVEGTLLPQFTQLCVCSGPTSGRRGDAPPTIHTVVSVVGRHLVVEGSLLLPQFTQLCVCSGPTSGRRGVAPPPTIHTVVCL